MTDDQVENEPPRPRWWGRLIENKLYDNMRFARDVRYCGKPLTADFVCRHMPADAFPEDPLRLVSVHTR